MLRPIDCASTIVNCSCTGILDEDCLLRLYTNANWQRQSVLISASTLRGRRLPRLTTEESDDNESSDATSHFSLLVDVFCLALSSAIYVLVHNHVEFVTYNKCKWHVTELMWSLVHSRLWLYHQKWPRELMLFHFMNASLCIFLKFHGVYRSFKWNLGGIFCRVKLTILNLGALKIDKMAAIGWNLTNTANILLKIGIFPIFGWDCTLYLQLGG